MNPPDDASKELEQLLTALVDGELTPAQQQHLSALLRDDPALQQQYRDYLLLDSLLHWEQPAASATVPVPVPVPAPRRRLRRYGLLAAALAAGLLVALLLSPRKKDTTDPQPERTDNTVAVLIRAPGAEWEPTGLPTRPGAPLPAGLLRLKKGIAHIEFYSGATVILQGPAEFRLISRMEGYCSSGKLRVVVPPHAQGFTVNTPKLELVDHGTEFGLDVGEGTEVHVFQGRVDVFDAGSNRSGESQKKLTTGNAFRLDARGAGSNIPSDPKGFLSTQGLAERVRDEARRQHRAWLAASQELRKRDDLEVYYSFQYDETEARTLFDHAEKVERPHNGTIVGCSWVTGRWPGKRALEFKQVSDRVRLRGPEEREGNKEKEFPCLTLATWVRIDGLPNINNALLMSDGWEEGEVHWQIGSTGTLIFAVQGPGKKVKAHHHAVGAITPDHFDRWLHLAVVYDGESGFVTHYIDGKQIARLRIEFDMKLRIGDAELGNWTLGSYKNSCPVRHFSGCMDEFMLFSTALSGEQIDQLYLQGKPPF